MIMALVSGTTGIPRRILVGSEAGQLASEQDRANWAERIQERRALFANPSILDPTVMLLQTVGLVPEGDFEWDWPSAFIQNPLEEGQTMAQTARAIGNISRQTGGSTPMQLISREEGRKILGYVDDLDESDLYEPPDWQIKDTAPAKSQVGEPPSDAKIAKNTIEATNNATHAMTHQDALDVVDAVDELGERIRRAN